jgi:hypothetical protein
MQVAATRSGLRGLQTYQVEVAIIDREAAGQARQAMAAPRVRLGDVRSTRPCRNRVACDWLGIRKEQA